MNLSILFSSILIGNLVWAAPIRPTAEENLGHLLIKAPTELISSRPPYSLKANGKMVE
jgi:hypothetical protein